MPERQNAGAQDNNGRGDNNNNNELPPDFAEAFRQLRGGMITILGK